MTCVIRYAPRGIWLDFVAMRPDTATKRKILIVDGRRGVANELETQLTRLGYEVAGIAASRDAGIAQIPLTEPDLILMDVATPDGVEAANELQRNSKIPVLLMIAATDEANLSLTRFGESPLHRYVIKPFTQRELHGSIELACAKDDAARAVHELEDRFFTNSVDMLCFLDFNGYFKRLNPAWERTLGYTRQELMSRPFIEFVHPDDRERTLKQNATVRGGGQALAFENRYVCKDGSYRWFHWNAASDSTDKVIYSVARDVTASKKAEEERERILRELQAAAAELKTLQEILPICSYCRKIRDDENYWHTVENYISQHTNSLFSHGICPDCMAAHVDTPRPGLNRG